MFEVYKWSYGCLKMPLETTLSFQDANRNCTNLGDYKLLDAPIGVDPVEFVTELAAVGKIFHSSFVAWLNSYQNRYIWEIIREKC